jgi:outer membrane receptor protein involved in Fe transport
MKQRIVSLAALALLPTAVAHAQTAHTAAPAAKDAPSVVVTARRLKVQTLIDRRVYTITGDLQETTGSAADVMNALPSVNVDPDGVVSLRGDTNVTILIDGKASAALSGAALGLSLLQLPASDIDRIEVLNTPPAQYKAEGSGGVINIITRKHPRSGLSGTARASVGDHGRYALGLDGAYNAGKLKLSGGVGLRQDNRERRTTDHRFEIDPTSGLPVMGAESVDEHFHRLTPSVNGRIDYALNARQTLGASFSYRALHGHRFFDQVDLSGPPGAAPTSVVDRHSEGHEWHVEGGGDVHFTQDLWRPGETLTLQLQRSTVYENENYDYTDTFPTPPAPAAFSDLRLGLNLRTTEFSADYDLPLPHDADLKLGYDLEADDNAFDNRGHTIDLATHTFTVDPNVTNDFRYRQQVNAAYGQYAGGIGDWRLQAGLRVEDARASWLLITGDIPGHRHDFGVYPSLHLDRAVGRNGKLTLGVSRRITRPDPEALNPFSDHQNIHNLRAGNPNLAPQDTWKYEAGYQFTGATQAYGVTLYYRTDRDSVTDVVQPVGPNVVLATRANLPKSQSAGAELSASGKLGRSLSYTLDGTLFYTQIDARLLGATGLRSTTGLDLKASLEYRPTPADTLQLSFSRQDRRLTPQGSVSAIDLVNLGYKHAIRPNLSLVATLSDAFDGQRFERLVRSPVLVDRYQRFQLGQLAMVGLVWSFGGPAKGKTDFEYDQP